jgi:hypothetical protein
MPAKKVPQLTYKAFLIHPTPSMNKICVAASYTFDFKTSQMYVYMHAQQSYYLERFWDLIESGVVEQTYFLLPSLIVKQNLDIWTRLLNKYQNHIVQFETTLGVRYDRFFPMDPNSIDFDRVSQGLNSAITNLAFGTWHCKTTAKLLDFLDEIASKYREMALKNEFPREKAEEVERLLLDTHKYLRSRNSTLEDRIGYLERRAQACNQTNYSGIAQRDSKNNLELAHTSAKLAETSKQLAISTSQDSAVMRIIAAITIFFLPATFTAVSAIYQLRQSRTDVDRHFSARPSSILK